MGSGVCYQCGKIGHIKRDFPSLTQSNVQAYVVVFTKGKINSLSIMEYNKVGRCIHQSSST